MVSQEICSSIAKTLRFYLNKIYQTSHFLTGATDSTDFTTAPGITGITSPYDALDLAIRVSEGLTLDESGRRGLRIVTDIQLAYERAGIYDLTE